MASSSGISAPATLLELLEVRAGTLGAHPLYTFLEDGGDDAVLSYAGLDVRARRIGAALQALAAAGERAVLLYPPGLEYVAGFFGCLYAGLVAVPAYPPDPMRLDRTLPRLRAIIRDARASVVLTTSFIQEMGAGLFEGAPELASLRWLATDALPDGGEADWRRPVATRDTLAFLQYTSGSTGDPKGVQLSHGNLIHNLGLISEAFAVRSDSVGVIWLPPYHDMGLIGGILQPLFAGFPVALMSPLAFLRRPRFWLEALTRFGGSISGGPCFAFDLCVRKVPEGEREGLDLSRWELAFCGAEPIRPEVMDRFCDAFSPSGFHRGALYPCYGLAEGTLIASGGTKGEGTLARSWDAAALERNEAVEADGSAGTRVLVGCGRTLTDQALLVVDPETRRVCPPERVGEVWVSGPSVAQGYWGRPELTEETFGARLADEGAGRRFLRTGDLGLLRDGELFVVGRRKDLIILRGRNLHPQDLELTIERSHPALRPGCGAAFPIEVDGEERLAVMQEVDARKAWTPDEVVGAVRRALSETHEVQLHTLVLIEPGALPKTSSGKVQRRAARAELLAGASHALSTWRESDVLPAEMGSRAPVEAEAAPVSVEELESWLIARIAARLRVRRDEVARDVPITVFGMDSLAAVELARDIEALGAVLRMEVLLQGPSVAELARAVFSARTAKEEIPRHPEGTPGPLSSAQQRLWLFEQLEQGSAAYLLPAAVRLSGDLDEAALERAFVELLRRHSALRATFREEDGVPVQVTASDVASPFRRVDLRDVPAGEREAEALRRAREEARRRFDLSRGPLLRATLWRLEAREFLLVVVMHHIASDGTSFAILARELSALYAAFSAGREVVLPPLQVQYADQARWRRGLEAGDALASSMEWWRQRLSGAPAALELPTDRPRPAVPSYRGSRVAVRIPEALTSRLEAVGRGEGATLFMTLLAAFQVLLGRHSGQDDLCIGTPVDGRDRASLEGLVGCFLDLLVLRTSISGAPTFRELLGRSRDTALGAFAHREVPFERLVEGLVPARDRSRAPLFQVLFVLQPEPGAGLSLPSLEARRVELDSGATPYDLTLSLARGAEGLEGWFEYATDLFDAGTADRWVERLRVLLEAIAERPEARISALPLLSGDEQRRVLVEWNDTRVGYEEASLAALISAQAARTPRAVALVRDDVVLTYRELDRRANAVAWRLRAQGVGPEVVVGLCAERSLDLVVGLLGILKAGGAYLPLDPSYPEARLALMLEDSAAPVVLTRRHLSQALPSGARAVVLLDAPEGGVPEEAETSPEGAGPDQLAYVLYTSGSTGRPKGVLIPHRNVASFFTGMDARVGTGQGTWLAVTSVSFDISVLELLWTLSRGFKVVIAGGRDAGSVSAQVRRHSVTHLQCTPSLAQSLLLEPDSAGALAGVSRLMVGGEALSAELAARLRGLVGGELLNMYGPTETTIWSSTHRVEDTRGSIPIGTPIANTGLYVLDAALRPVPIGVPGELFIGGEGVARGYHARPDLTAERFVPEPFSGRPGARMYRTGDLARWRDDGTVEFLGRVDHQVKVRGFRVEPGEIEAALEQHPRVRNAVVVAREDVAGARLVAYVVPASGSAAPEASMLRTWLAGRLPEHLVPSAFLVLEALPLTPNGKVDRKALPVPDAARESTRAHVAPETDTERRMAEIWSSLLGVDRVGAGDDFFALGGHSLVATRLAARLRDAFGVEVSLRDVFEASTLKALSARVEALPRTAEHVLQRVSREGDVPLALSFAQQRLWFLDQLQSGKATYNIPAALRLSGALRVDVLQRTFTEVVRRHEALRTTFITRDGRPQQRIHAAPEPWPLPVESLEELDPVAREAAALRRTEEELRQAFDLEKGPLLRTVLLRLGAEEHLLLLCMHHIISDAWSMGVLVREVAELYEALSRNREPDLPELPVQYADYAAWERRLLDGPAVGAQLDWWRSRLVGAPVLELPTDALRPPVRTLRGTTHFFSYPPALKAALERMGQEQGGATLFMVLMAGWQALLARYSGQTDFCVGTSVAHRTRPELEGLIGLFVNLLTLRCGLDGDPTFSRLLRRVREESLAVFARQDVPFDRLVEAVGGERDLARTPLFQVLFVLQNAPIQAPALSGVQVNLLPSSTDTSRFDLTLSLMERAGGLEGQLEYSTDLFSEGTIRRMVGHLRVLLEAVAGDGGRRLSQLPLMEEAERGRVLVEWNDTRVEYPSETPIHALFTQQAMRTPEAVAVESGEERLTYRELEERSNQVARHLVGRGLRAEARVGLSVTRGVEMVVGLLGILKAGGCYVPLDPSYPAQRLGFQIEDAGVAMVLTLAALEDDLPAFTQPMVVLDAEWAEISAQSVEPVGVEVDARQLAYVTYTSGSTGKPKGVAVVHRGVVRLLKGAEYVRLGPGEVVLQSAPLAFDASTLEIWGALLSGARLVMYPAQPMDLEELGRVLVKHRVSVLWLTAALFEQMQQHQPEALAGVAQVLAGGDVLPVPRVRERLAHGGVLVNGYGPTEGTTFTACHRMERGEEVGHSVSIGRPIANTQVYVLDAGLHPTPIGVPGELFIGGDGLARGYLGRPELTAERFVPNPFATEPGARLYRTGDRVKWRVDGTLEFLGRADFQVKLRGFRIELGEIEARLRQAPEVDEAVVVLREDAPGDKRLVAYVVPRASHPLAEGGLRNHLRSHLPEYMVPSAIVAMPALPLSANGKVDRRKLPAPVLVHATTAETQGPESLLQRQLIALFQEILRIDRVGLDDDFFELGGHSLLATQLVTRVRSQLGVDLPLRALFEAPTVTRLSARVEALLLQASRSWMPPLLPAERGAALPLSFAQQRLWFLDQLQPGQAVYNIPIVLRLTGALRVDIFQRTFEELVRRHETLRTTFVSYDGLPTQCIHPAPAQWPLPVEDLTALEPEAREEAVRRRMGEEAHHVFDLSTGPLLRTVLLKTREEEHMLLLCMHHIVSDGWSMGVLVREVAALYEALGAGRAPELPELPVQYADFSVWQREWARSEAMQRQLEWWCSRLRGVPVLELPADTARGATRGLAGSAHFFTFPPELVAGLEKVAREQGATLFMVLLAGWKAILSRYSGQVDFCIGTPVANRTRPELEGLIGFFVNTLVLRTSLEGDPSFETLVERTRETALSAYVHQDVAFDRVVEALGGERSAGRTPLFQVMFALQNAPMGQPSLAGLELERIPNATETSRFDMTLSLLEKRGELVGQLEHSTDLISPDRAQRMVEQLRTLLTAVAGGGKQQRLSQLPLMEEAERGRVLVEWNDTRVEYPSETPIHALFTQQAMRTPEAVAVESGEERLTYRELEERSNQVARHLVGRGLRAEARVGLSVTRGVEMVVGLLGILKAGGCYVPLDPSYPAQRLGFLAADSQVEVVLTQRSVKDSLSALTQPVVVLDAERAESSAQSVEPVGVEVDARQLAYVTYTSGSTGKPKGVAVVHRGVVRLLKGAEYVRLGPGEVVLQSAPLAFDASTLEIWGALLSGARLVMYPAQPMDLEELGRVIVRHQVSVLWITTALFDQFQRHQPDILARVPQVLTGGEVMPPARVRERLGQGCALVHAYGPTESTTFTTCHLFEPGDDAGHSVSIGWPIANTTVYVLGEAMQPLPVGVPGELFIGGEGLARGYLGRPDLTAERFVPNPFAAESGARLYRTGDRVRWRADGTLEFLGRFDFQVKLRGFRIELGEVEAALRQSEDVAEAVVVVREDVPGDKRLVAYVVPRTPLLQGEGGLSLREQLREQLPAHMVPSAIVVMPALPLSANGKVDRRRLPVPVHAATAEEAIERTPVQRQLATLFQEVLHVARVGLDDDFFELGGHSLLATQLVTRVRAQLQVDLPLRAFFEAPTVAQLASRLEALSPQAARSAAASALARVDRTSPLPLSFAQQRLWFLEQLQPGQAVYNIPIALQVTGPLRVDILRRTFEELVRRHESLRTTFDSNDGQPRQRIHPAPSDWPLPVEDLSALEPEAREESVRRRMSEEAHHVFDLSTGPLLRTVLLKMAAEAHVLLLCMHHIVSDGWSMGVLVREVAALYEALGAGRAPALPELPVQYADFAAWQHQGAESEALKTQLDWWCTQLKGAPTLDLPAKTARATTRGVAGRAQPFALPRSLVEKLERSGREQGATLFMVLLAGWKALLGRYSGQEDLSIGTPVANRTRPELEGLIGFFVNTLVLRTSLEGDPSFEMLVERTRETALAAYVHQDVAFDRVVEALGGERSAGSTPLFQVMFVLQNAPMQPPSLSGVTLERMPHTTETSRFDLTLSLMDREGALEGQLEYSTDLFSADTSARMVRHLRVLLEAVAEGGKHQRLSRLPLMDGAERDQVLVEWSGLRASGRLEGNIPLVFESHARATPEAVAVESEGRTLTYAQLDARSNRLARHLVSLGVGPESRVALCLERGLELIVGLLGVLKAGGCYVPLDPDYPRQRLAFMLEDTAPAVVLSQQSLRELLPEHSRPTVLLDADGSAFSHLSPEPLDVRSIGPGRLAYVLYTSGSTGQPKQVGVEHRSVMSVVRDTNYVRLTPDDCMAQIATASFDAATFEIWGALLNGARLAIISREISLSPTALGRRLREVGATASFLTTSLFNEISREQPESLASLRQLYFGGEKAEVRAAHRVASAGSFQCVTNGYGPTETTVFAASHPVSEVPADATSFPIGRPLTRVRLYVLDAHGRPVAVGVPGGLYIGGEGLSRGYLGHPALTAERFVPDDFSGEPGARLYRTGDRVIWRADGVLDYLGREDTQIKLRGFRIEPGEIEARLRQVPGVEEAVVVVREDTPGDRRLVAYVVPRTPLNQGEGLREHLRSHLPEHMVPSAFVLLERLPLTANHKVDRQALPAPQLTDLSQHGTPSEAPRNPTEELLAGLFAEMLNVARVGIHDNFFDLGGHSLLATRVVARILATFGVALSLRELFEAPTVAGLAARLAAARQLPETLRPPPISSVSREGPLPLSLMQERLWLLEQLQPGTALYNVPWVSWLDGALNVSALEKALAGLIERHEALRTSFHFESGAPVQRIGPVTAHALPLVDLRDVPETQREAEALRAAGEEARRPFELSRGPLVRLLLLRTAEERHLLVLTLHHIVSDGWSLGVAIRELTALYTAAHEDRPSTLQAPTLHPADHAVWQRSWLQGEALEAQLGYWRQRLAGAPPVLELPSDFPRPTVQRFRGATLPVHLPADLSTALRALCRREGVTPFMGLLAGFQLLLSRYTGQEDLCVGAPIAGRHHAGLENLIGFFVNTLVLRTRLAPESSFRELLSQVREGTLGAFAHQDVPFEKLVEVLQPPRSLSHAPLVQVAMALQETPWRDAALPGVAVRPVDVGSGTAKYDLMLSLSESPDGYAGSVEYDADLFAPETVARMMGHLRALLEGAVADPTRRIGDLPLMSEPEWHRLRVEWNDTDADYSPEKGLTGLFEEQVARTPDAVAVELLGARLTYRELDRRSNQLAHHLIQRGVGRGTPVGMFVQRSLEMVVGTLAILKAGGAYVPLDPLYPSDRLTFMLEDTGVPLVLAQHHVLERLPETNPPVVLLDTGWEEISRQPDTSPGRGGTSEDLAYIMYTSGSTGRSKGVCVPQRGVMRLVLGNDYLDWGPQETFLLISPYMFDVSVLEIWGSLLHGSRLVVLPPQTPTVDSLKEVIERDGITVMWLTSGLFESFSAARPEALDGVRQLMSGGDALPPAAVRERLSRGGSLLNGYGPTECSTFTTTHFMKGSVPEGTISIGKPISNTRVYVVDGRMQPVPVGVPGELVVGGPGVAWGYLKRPELTAERFVPDPFGPTPGARLYHTGDRVRWREDGTLEFLGRFDAQVKVRGYRVEPGEVEELLRKHPAVSEVSVVPKPDPAGGKRLVAYVVSKSPPGESQGEGTAELRAFVAAKLPEFMVPAVFVFLPALPLSPNGKVDRRALPEPEVSRPAGAAFVEPTTELERQVAEVWAQVLGMKQVGVEDHFFADLGGSSMSVVKACALLRDTLKRDVPATRFFEHPTVRAFAAALEKDGVGSAEGQDNEVHVDRAQQRRQALRRQGRRGTSGNE